MDPPPAAPDRAWSRRHVLGGVLAAGAGLALPRGATAGPAPAALPRRPFGRTGLEVSVFGLGCFYLGAAPSDGEGADVVRRALDLGCTYFDTAPSYFDGASERRLGQGLRGRRDAVVLATKTLARTADEAQREIEASLRRLGTDHVDLLQIHCVRDAADLERVLSESGPLPAILRAREKGQVRFVGVTGHEDPVVMKACVERHAWDSVLLPLNPADLHWKSFVEGALPAAVGKGIARVAMKVFASGRLVAGARGLPPEDCLRFTYGLDVSTAVVGCASIAQVDLAARVAAEARPLDAARRAALIEEARRFSGRPESGVEWYKRA
jgi:aryl-alcohol dehydrogenase-like predicted oxidoreductase